MPNNEIDVLSKPKVVRRSTNRSTRKPTLKQKKFVEEYLNNGGNASKAAMVAYDAENMNTARAMGSENLTKPAVLALLNSKEQRAEQVVVDILESKEAQDKDRLSAAKLLLAYTRGNPVSRNENINVNVSLEDILASDD